MVLLLQRQQTFLKVPSNHLIFPVVLRVGNAVPCDDSRYPSVQYGASTTNLGPSLLVQTGQDADPGFPSRKRPIPNYSPTTGAGISLLDLLAGSGSSPSSSPSAAKENVLNIRQFRHLARECDRDGDGVISKSECQRVLVELGVATHPAAILEFLDTAPSGICYELLIDQIVARRSVAANGTPTSNAEQPPFPSASAGGSAMTPTHFSSTFRLYGSSGRRSPPTVGTAAETRNACGLSAADGSEESAALVGGVRQRPDARTDHTVFAITGNRMRPSTGLPWSPHFATSQRLQQEKLLKDQPPPLILQQQQQQQQRPMRNPAI